MLLPTKENFKENLRNPKRDLGGIKYCRFAQNTLRKTKIQNLQPHNFVQSFMNLIEAKTADSKLRLHYLVQYTRGDVHDTMKSCLVMEPERGYIKACRLLKKGTDKDTKSQLLW